MGRLLEKIGIPFIHIFDWANGDKYTAEEDTTILPPELAESAQKIEEQADKHFKTQSKGNGGKGKGKSQFKVEKDQLNTEKVEEKEQKAKENDDKEMEI